MLSHNVYITAEHRIKTLTLGMHDEEQVAEAEPLRCKGSIRKGNCPMKSLILSASGVPTMQVARYIVEACHMKTKASCSKSPCQAHSHFVVFRLSEADLRTGKYPDTPIGQVLSEVLLSFLRALAAEARAESATTPAALLARSWSGRRPFDSVEACSRSTAHAKTCETPGLADGLHVLGGRSEAEENEGQKHLSVVVSIVFSMNPICTQDTSVVSILFSIIPI